MKKASLTETKNRLSALIDEVREGETILVLDRGRPVAKIESAVGASPGSPGRLERLERKGHVVRAAKRTPKKVLETKPPKAKRGGSVLQALLDERRAGR